MPPGIAAKFTLGEQAALAVIVVEIGKRGDCRLSHEHIAAVAGVSRSTVKRALHQARINGLITIRERRLSRYRNETNVITIIDRSWLAWMRLARTGGGVQTGTGTNTRSISKGRQRASQQKEGAFEMEPSGQGNARSVAIATLADAVSRIPVPSSGTPIFDQAP
ncbi:helix-turn-helix domain-containing protein [Methylobacterium sp. CM6247]